MNVLIVYAHHEPKSFNGALKDIAVAVLTEVGHQVKVSDLYAMNFKAIADRADFKEMLEPDYLKYGIEQRHAYENDALADDIKAEQEKLRWADLLILQFPIYWFSVPAILKGWVDRVFTTGFAYSKGMSYDTGGLKGKRAMLSFTTGDPFDTYAHNGRHGDIDIVLWPIQNGILRFVGFDVLPPFIAWSAARGGQEIRERHLVDYRGRLLALDRMEPLFFHLAEDYNESWRLRPGIEARTPGQRTMARDECVSLRNAQVLQLGSSLLAE